MTEEEASLSIRREVDLWLDAKGFQKRDYVNLPSYCKDLLHNLICTPTKPTTGSQRRDLYRKLCSQGVVSGRDSTDPVDLMTDEEIQKFLSPRNSSERLRHLYKY